MKHRQWIYRWISSRSISVQNCLIRGEIEIKIGVVFILFADNNNDNNLISIQSKEYEKKHMSHVVHAFYTSKLGF